MNIIKLCEKFYADFSGEKGIIGYSQNHKPIYYFCVKKSEKPIIIVQCAIHAREYITSYLCLKLIEDFTLNGRYGKVFFIPMSNPDGVEIALNENPLYKANARGVDLNVNFDANWGKGENNLFIKGSENYIGQHPFSENESRALRDFTLLVKPHLTLSYHAKGEEIYYYFNQRSTCLAKSKKVAKIIAEQTGYKIKNPKGSVGGYKDWCIKRLKLPSITIEVGRDELFHPITEEFLPEIYNKNKNVLTVLTQNEGELWN